MLTSSASDVWRILAAGEAIGTQQARKEARRRASVVVCGTCKGSGSDVCATAQAHLQSLARLVQESRTEHGMAACMAQVIAGDPFPEEQWGNEFGYESVCAKYVWTAIVASVKSVLANWQRASCKQLRLGSSSRAGHERTSSSSADQAFTPQPASTTCPAGKGPSRDASSTLHVSALLEIVRAGVGIAVERAGDISRLAMHGVSWQPFSVDGASDLAAVDRLVAEARVRRSADHLHFFGVRAARVSAATVTLNQAPFEEIAQLPVAATSGTCPDWVVAVAELAADRLANEQLPKGVALSTLMGNVHQYLDNVVVVAAPVPASLFFRVVDDAIVDLFGRGTGTDALEACVGLPEGKAERLLVTTDVMKGWLDQIMTATAPIVIGVAPHQLNEAAVRMAFVFLRSAAYLSFYATQHWEGYTLAAPLLSSPIVIPATKPFDPEDLSGGARRRGKLAAEDLIHNHICKFAGLLTSPITHASLELWLKILTWTLNDMCENHKDLTVNITLEALLRPLNGKADFRADWHCWRVYLEAAFIPTVLHRVRSLFLDFYISMTATHIPCVAEAFKRAELELSLCGDAPATSSRGKSTAAAAVRATRAPPAGQPTAGRKAKKPQAKDPKSLKPAPVPSAVDAVGLQSIPPRDAWTATSPAAATSAAPSERSLPTPTQPATIQTPTPSVAAVPVASCPMQAARPAAPITKAGHKKAAAKQLRSSKSAQPELAPGEAAQAGVAEAAQPAAVEVAQVAAVQAAAAHRAPLAAGLPRVHANAGGVRAALPGGWRDTAEHGMLPRDAAAASAHAAARHQVLDAPGGAATPSLPSTAAAAGVRSGSASPVMSRSTAAVEVGLDRPGISLPVDPGGVVAAAAAPLDVADLIHLPTAQQPLNPHAPVQHHQLSPGRAVTGEGAAGRELPTEAHPEDDVDELDEDLRDMYCPITFNLMQDPVMASDSHSYERSAIEEWLSRKDTSPLTGAPLHSKQLLPNKTLQKVIQGHIAKQARMAKQSSASHSTL